jgi:hypothetical protein
VSIFSRQAHRVEGAREWRRWEANIRTLSKPDAALQIARFVSASHGAATFLSSS